MRALSRDTATLFIVVLVAALVIPVAVGAAAVRENLVSGPTIAKRHIAAGCPGDPRPELESAGQESGVGRGTSVVATPGHRAHLAVAGATLDLGPQAVNRWTTITAKPLRQREVAALDAGMTNVTAGPPGYRFLPHPHRFHDALVVALPYCRNLIPAGFSERDVRTFYFDDKAGIWKPLAPLGVNTDAELFVSRTNHFTDMINATITVPDHPEPVAFDPTSIKDIKTADPSSGINLIQPPEPNNLGEARLSYPIELPAGRQGMQPSLAVTYNSSASDGWLGVGWDLHIPSVTVDTRWGVPRYARATETETYLLDGAQLTPVAHRGAPRARNGLDEPEKIFHTRVEGNFNRIIRHGDRPSNYSWEVIDKKGTRYFYGAEGAPGQPSTLRTGSGEIFRWALQKVRDLNGNGIEYSYVRVADPQVAAGRQLYLSSINYTQSNGAAGAYTVTFLRDSEQPDYLRRTDVLIDARGGFKLVTAELLKRIEVTFQRDASSAKEPIRSYDLEYREGAFGKTLLSSITPRGADGAVLAAPHEFTYYNEGLRFGESVDWDTGKDGVAAGLFQQGEPSGLSGTITDSVGGHIYLGFNPLLPTKQGSVGAKVGFNYSGNSGVLALADLNGDGLPDKIFCADWVGFTCNSFAFRPNRSGPDGGTVFAQDRPINLPAISHERSIMTSFGLEAYFGASVAGNLAQTITIGSTYFSDVNADGLLDLVHDGAVFFNHLDENRNPTFTTSSSATPVPLRPAPQAVRASALLPSYGGIRQDEIDTFPLQDTLRRWIAPFSGVVRVTGDIALIKDSSKERQEYETADGVRVAIQRNGAELWATRIAADDYTPRSPSGTDAIHVQKGDRLYFRVQSVLDGRYDQVKWDPEIGYLGVPDTVDVNGLNPLRYRAGQDFTLAGRPGISVAVPLTGTVRLTGELHKDAATTDDVTLVVRKNGTRLFSKTLTWSQSGAISLAEDIQVVSNSTARDMLQLRIEVASPIDLSKLRWDPSPDLFYVTTVNPNQAVRDSAGDNLIRLPAPYDIDVYPADDLTSPQGSWTVPSVDALLVRSALATFTGDVSTSGRVTLTVKRPGELIAKRSIGIVNGRIGNVQFRIPAKEDDELSFDYSTLDPELSGKLRQKRVVVRYVRDGSVSPLSIVVPSAFHSAASLSQTGNGLFGQPYRGWGYAGYNGNRQRALEPIDESTLVQKEQKTEQCQDDAALRQSLADGFSTADFQDAVCNPVEDPAYPFTPMPAEAKWRGSDELGWVRADEMSSSRLGADTIDVPVASEFRFDATGATARAVSRVSRTTQVALTAGIGPAGASGSIGTSTNDLDFLDMNGDGFPDIVGNGHVQYSDPNGVLAEEAVAVPMLASVRATDSRAGNLSIGGTIAMFRSDDRARVDAPGRGAPKENSSSGSQMVPLGLNAGLGLGGSDVSLDLLDVNGDGLPDRITRDGSRLMIALNLGYSFAAPESWGDVEINSGESESGSLGLSLGFNTGIYDYAGGVSSNKTKSLPHTALLDVNGDGLVDQVIPTAEGLRVRFNTGDGFSSTGAFRRALPTDACDDQDIGFQVLPGGPDWTNASVCDGNTGLGLGAYFTVGLGPLCCYVIINPGAEASENMSRQEAALRDVDGDGFLDEVASKSDRTLTVARNLIGDTNMLKSVSRPLGARIDLQYSRDGNTYAQPNSRWVMSRVSVFDGQRDVTSGEDRDGADTQVTTYRYEGGHYDRLEREFYGYRSVSEELRDESGSIYRRVVREYRNDGYYTKGLLARQFTEDGSGTQAGLGHRFVEVENGYFVLDLDTGAALEQRDEETAAAFPELRRVERRFYEGEAVARKTTETTYRYDDVGNVTEIVDAGDAGPDDDVVATIAYTKCDRTYVVGEPTKIVVQNQAAELRHREATVDCATGQVIQIRQFLENGVSADTNLEYFANGNLRRVEGPKNLHQDRYSLTYEYDADVSTHIARTSDSFDYTSSATYDPRFGVVTSVIDTNGNATAYSYDAFGRLTDITGPYDQNPKQSTIHFEYHPGGDIPWALTQHRDSSPSGVDPIETVVFVDGLRRVLETKKDATIHTGARSAPQDVMVVSGRVRFDFAGRAISQRYPISEPLGTPGTFNRGEDSVAPTRIDYDLTDRVTEMTSPDRARTSTKYGFASNRAGGIELARTVTDPNGNQKTILSDVRQQAVDLEEFHKLPDGRIQALWTSYVYDPLGQLVGVEDAKNNLTKMDYDNLGRRVAIDNPDTGRVETQYDLASNVIAKITPRLRAENKRISYDYEFQRLKAISYPTDTRTNVAYHYGSPSASDNRAGRLTSITDESGTEERFYGKLGEITKEIKTVNTDTGGSPDSYTTSYVYDSFGRMKTLTYPDGEVLSYSYDAGGEVRRAVGRKAGSTYEYVRRLEYNTFGQRAFLELGNGTTTQWAYRDDNRRLLSVKSVLPAGKLFQNLGYTYDAVGNIKTLTNDVPIPSPSQFGGPSSQQYSYDDLYQLIDASGSYRYAPNKIRKYTVSLSYDAIHNIVSKTQTDTVEQPSGVSTVQKPTTYDWTYTYDGPRPHAATHIGDRIFTYGPGGNQLGWTDDRNGTHRTVVWDDENRVQGVIDNGHEMTYKYNEAGERSSKRGPQGETTYVNQYFTIRNREVGTKHIFIGGERIASKLMKKGAPFEKDQYFYHTDHVGSTNFVTDANGRLYQHVEYFPFGETWIDESTNIQRTPYRFTAKEFDEETGLYYYGARYYDPQIDVFASPDPLAIVKPENLRGRSQTLSVYTYVGNNPLRFVDRAGLEEEDAGQSSRTEASSEPDIAAPAQPSESGPQAADAFGAGLASLLSYRAPGQYRLSFRTTFKGSTSVFFLNRLPEGKSFKGLRLDYGFNKTTSSVNWHWNQKGSFADFLIADHAVASANAARAGVLLKYGGIASRGLLAVGVAVDAYSLTTQAYTSFQTGEWSNTTTEAARIAGGWAGAWAGAEALGTAGAWLGAPFGPAGMAVGGFVGGLVGGALGYYGVSRVAVSLVIESP
jgi:RHS repeat-associated protein